MCLHKKKTIVILIALSILCCTKLSEILAPYTPSRVTLTGRVLDEISLQPIKRASIKVESISDEIFTDDSGFFEIKQITTGLHRFRVESEKYKILELNFDVTLSPKIIILILERKDEPPQIENFFVERENLRFYDDSIKLFFTVTDSSGGIKRINLYCSDTSLPIRTYDFQSPVYSFSDSFKYRASSTGKQKNLLVATDSRNYSVEDSLIFEVPYVKRPIISQIRFSEGGFISGEWGYIEIFVEDSDSVFDFLSIDWRDDGDSVISYECEGVYWRKLIVKEYTEWKVEIKLFSLKELVYDTIVEFPVRVISPPLLDDKIYLNSKYCAPHDTAIIIGVNVLKVEKESFVKEILWIINEGEKEPVFTFFRERYNQEDGRVPPLGKLFIHQFTIQNFKGTNIVKIIVTDGNGNSSMISGVFYVAGKPD